MMKMYLDLAQPFALQGGKFVQGWRIILLARKEIGMAKESAIMIAKRIAGAKSQFAPAVNRTGGCLAHARLEMVRNHEDNVRGAIVIAAREVKLAGTPKWIPD
jgi:hypothetical protein